MRVIEVSVEVGRTSSVDYQSARNSISFTAKLEAHDEPDKVVRTLQQRAVDLLLGDEEGNPYAAEVHNVTSIDARSLETTLEESSQTPPW
jgi:hypothetical protein